MPPFLRPILSFGLLLSACSPAHLLNGTISSDGLAIVRDIPYEPGARHSMDIYRPASAAGPVPVAVFFYGGAWQTGSKREYMFVAAELARRGVMVAVPDYRLYPDVQYPAFLDDAARAVAAVREAAPSWGGDPNRVFLVGHSAGAYIAAMLALDPDLLAAAGDPAPGIAGAVGISGPYDFLPIQGPDIRAVFGDHANDPATQPVNHVDGRNPPMLLLQGEADDTVFPRNTTSLESRIRAAGGPVEAKLYPGLGHIGAVLSFAPLFRSKSSVLDDTADFILHTPASVPAAARETGRAASLYERAPGG